MVLRLNLKLQQKFQKIKINVFEVPISIYSRRYDEGKKVKWWDFFCICIHFN